MVEVDYCHPLLLIIASAVSEDSLSQLFLCNHELCCSLFKEASYYRLEVVSDMYVEQEVTYVPT